MKDHFIRRAGKEGPEAKVKADIKKMLERRGWFVIVTHGNIYQHGLPDLYACMKPHKRWIEVKDPLRKGKASLFTPAQMEVFPRLSAEGVGIWILTAATDTEYNKLFAPPNWWVFLT